MAKTQDETEELGMLSRELYLHSLKYGVKYDAPPELLRDRKDGRYWMEPLKYLEIENRLREIDRSIGHSLGSALVNDYYSVPHFYSGKQPEKFFLYVLRYGLVEVGKSEDMERNTVTVWPFETTENLERILKVLDLPLPNNLSTNEANRG